MGGKQSFFLVCFFWNGNSREETKYDDGCDLVTVTGGEKAENYFTSTMFIHLIVDESKKRGRSEFECNFNFSPTDGTLALA